MVICLFQGVDASPDGLKLISEVIRGKLGITMTVLMGANIANEVADEKFCETTIGMATSSIIEWHQFQFLNIALIQIGQQKYLSFFSA